MRFTVDGWDPSYGTSHELDLDESAAEVDVDVELPARRWGPIDPTPVTPPAAVVFVDGVRRIEARVWVQDAAHTDAAVGICASYGAGSVCCCAEGAHLLTSNTERGLFTFAAGAEAITTWAGRYRATTITPRPGWAPAALLSAELQQALTRLERDEAATARQQIAGHLPAGADDLLVLDGPIRERGSMPRMLGFIKSHQASHLPAELHRLIGTLTAPQRTPVFRIGGQWERYSWYLRLPCLPASPWAGIVRLECPTTLTVADAIDLANLSQAVLPRFASVEYKDSRAPQNLVPVAGLERELRRRLGHPGVLYRALRSAAPH